MKKALLILIIIFVFTFNFSGAFAENNANQETLDIEKAAINFINNSTQIKSVDRSIKSAKDQYTNMAATRQQILNAMSHAGGGSNSFSLYKSYELLPYQIDYSITVANNSKDLAVASVRMQAYAQYINVLKLKYSVDIQTELVKSLQDNYSKSLISYKNGQISKNDLRLLEINLEKAKLQLTQYQRNYSSALMLLNNSMGVPLDTQYSSLDDKGITPSMEIASLESYISSALENRAEILNAKANLALQNKSFEFAKATQGGTADEYNDFVKEEQYNIDEAQNELELLKIDIQSEINSGYETLETKLKACESAVKQNETAKFNYDTAVKSYDLSIINTKGLEDAKIAYTQSQIQLKNAQLDLWLMEIKMDNASRTGPAITSIGN